MKLWPSQCSAPCAIRMILPPEYGLRSIIKETVIPQEQSAEIFWEHGLGEEAVEKAFDLKQLELSEGNEDHRG